MKFDTLANLIINEKKSPETKLVFTGTSPVFSRKDVKTFLEDMGEENDEYTSILRKLNAVTQKMVKKNRKRKKGITMDQFVQCLKDCIEEYETNILGWDHPSENIVDQIDAIGSFLLPNTPENPQGKGVFGPVREEEKLEEEVEEENSRSDTKLFDLFQNALNKMEVVNDSQLRDAIMEITSGGVTIRDILKDPRIEDQYDPNTVKFVVKGMINSGMLEKGEEGQIFSSSKSSIGDDIRNYAPERPVDIDDMDFEEDEDIIVRSREIEDEENYDVDNFDSPDWYPEDGKEEFEEDEDEYSSLDDLEDEDE